jgi:hypothetical protein
MDCLVPRFFRSPILWQWSEQALETFADKRVADVGAVRLLLHLVEVDGDGAGDAAKDIGRGQGFGK